MESEKTVMQALEKIMVERTTIVVSHRLSTVRKAETIAVLHHGKVVEHGSHAELTSDPNGEYSNLIRLQEKVLTAAQSQTRELDDRSSTSCRPSSQAESLDDNPSIDLSSPLLDQHERKAAETSLKELLERLIGKTDVLLIVVGCVASAARGVLLPAFGLAIACSISSFHEPPSVLAEHATFYGTMFVALGAASLVISPVKQCIFCIAGTRLVQHVRCYTFHKVIHQEIAWFDDPSNTSGAISARLTDDASSIKHVIGDALALVAEDTATLLAGFAISMATNWKLTFIVSSFLPFLILEGYAEMNFISATFKAAKERYEEAGNIANNAVSNIRTVASLCAQNKMVETYECKCQALKAHGIRQGITSAMAYGLSTMLVNSFHGACFFFGAMLVNHGNATIDQVFTVYLALSMAGSSMSQSCFEITSLLSKAKEAARFMRRILDRESKIDAGSTVGMILPHATVKGEMDLKNVSFRYPMRRHVEVLRGLCLTIPSCQTVALVGKSGSGKSTIIALLQRFYDPDHGTVTLDGVDLRSLNVGWLRQQMGLVAQEPALFDDTIWENIAYGARAGGGVSREEIVAAAEVAGAHRFISSLPCGYDTRVGARGVRLSGGQKQRVAIARVALRDPRVVLLDEATSALDSESECAVVQGVLGRLVMDGRRTFVVVAHRLATVTRADKIAVLKDGVIAEQGRHDDLLRQSDGIYSSIVLAS
ncbi:hypothetical protein ACQ4PT_039768 [Festuca glaucescens]